LFVIGGEKIGAISVHAVVTSCPEDDVTPMCIDHAIEKRREDFRLTLRLLPPSRPLRSDRAPGDTGLVRLEEGSLCLEEGPGQGREQQRPPMFIGEKAIQSGACVFSR
jgi:hypothetical protein